MVHRHYTSLHACNQWCMFYYMDTMFSILSMLFFYIPCFFLVYLSATYWWWKLVKQMLCTFFLFLYLYMAFTCIFINPFFNVECLYWYNVCTSIFNFTYLIYNMQPPHLFFLQGYHKLVFFQCTYAIQYWKWTKKCTTKASLWPQQRPSQHTATPSSSIQRSHHHFCNHPIT